MLCVSFLIFYPVRTAPAETCVCCSYPFILHFWERFGFITLLFLKHVLFKENKVQILLPGNTGLSKLVSNPSMKAKWTGEKPLINSW